MPDYVSPKRTETCSSNIDVITKRDMLEGNTFSSEEYLRLLKDFVALLRKIFYSFRREHPRSPKTGRRAPTEKPYYVQLNRYLY